MGGGGRDRVRETETDRQRERQTDTEKEKERSRERKRVREEGRAIKKKKNKHVRHILCYKMYKTLHGIKHHAQSQSTFTFFLIKSHQPLNQSRTSTTHNQTTFSLSLYIYSHISHSSQSYGQQYRNSKQYRISV